MRIGFDVDGVLANFIKAYIDLIIAVSGENKFLPEDYTNPPTWYFPEHRGYSKDVVRTVWKRINTDPEFWLRLEPLREADSLRWMFRELQMQSHDIYFVTNRSGISAKFQTEQWLKRLGFVFPTVLISEEKGLVCKALNLDVYIDDKLDNVLDAAEESPKTKVFCLDRAYNADDPYPFPLYTRVKTLTEFFKEAGL